MKDRKKQATAVVMATVLALTIATTTSFVSVYAQETNESTQAEGTEINATNFPDEAFRNYISTNFDKDNDTYLSQSEIGKAYTININGNENVTSLKGIENFTALTYLYCQNTGITKLDVSKNTELYYLQCNNTSINELDLSNNAELAYLLCNDTSITELGLDNNKSLTFLHIYNTSITSLNVKENKSLQDLNCSNTSITELDVSNNTALISLNCSYTNLTGLDVSNNTALTNLTCSYTNLTSLDVSSNTALTSLSCTNCNLAYLHIGNNNNLSVSKVQYPTLSITDKVGSSFDITEMFKGIDVSKITIKSSNVVMTDAGIISGYTTSKPTVVYEYDCGTAKNGNTHTMTVTLNLTVKDSRTITWNEDFSLDKTYDEKSVSITESDYTVSAGGGNVSFSYQRKNADGTWENIIQVPVNAGTYRVKAVVAEDDDYASAESEYKEFTISKASPKISFSQYSPHITYGNKLPILTATSSSGTPTVTYKAPDGTTYEDMDKLPDTPIVGTWTVTASVEATDNYNAGASITTIVVDKAQAGTISLPDNLSAKEGDELSTVELPENWAWVNQNEICTVNNQGYTARLSVDDANYDYSQVDGYNSDGHYVERTLTVTVYPKTEVLNAAPTITATDKTLTVGDTFDPLDGVSASDTEDGDLTSKITVEINTVDTANAGTYTVTYKVTDSGGASCTKTIYVTVNPKMETLNEVPVINAEDKTLTVGDTFDAMADVTATDTEDGDITKKIEVVNNTVDTSKAGTYEVTYKVTDSQGASTTKTITVTVKEKEDTENTSDDDKTDNDTNGGNTTDTSNNNKNSTDKNSTSSINSPKTGDNTNVGLCTSLLAMSGLLIAILAILRKKKAFGHK